MRMTRSALFLIGLAFSCPLLADEPFMASLYLGEAIDTFAGDETLDYLNPDDSGEAKQRSVGGFDFAYRMWEWGPPAQRRSRLWVYGETVHGVRSRDVDCQKNPDLSICKDAGFGTPNQQGVVYMLRNASSLEAFSGLRWDLLALNRGSGSPAWLYVKGQVGFLTVDGGGGDVIDMHQIAIGAAADEGPLRGSFFEVGRGRTDLFLRNPNDRWKFDGLLSFPLPFLNDKAKENLRGFVELTADTDFGSSSDAIQSYFGVDLAIWPRN